MFDVKVKANLTDFIKELLDNFVQGARNVLCVN